MMPIVKTIPTIDVTQRMFRWMFASRRAPRACHRLVASSLATAICRELEPVIVCPRSRRSRTKDGFVHVPGRLALEALVFGLLLLALDLSLRSLGGVQPSRFPCRDAR
jgi:hypothetical protein